MEANPIDKEKILEEAKRWFREVIIRKHKASIKKLSSPSTFKINPFLVKYVAYFLTGKSDPMSIAKALIYPRALGTSITTSFGQNAQMFINGALKTSLATAIAGLDIEFTDQVDGRKKYCQVKAGPDTVNKKGIEAIRRDFNAARGIARANGLRIPDDDFVIGILYGEHNQLNHHYKTFERDYSHPIYTGKTFWHHLTGDESFYSELVQAIASVAEEFDGSTLLEEAIEKLSKTAVVKKLAE
jgi:hypothetical protein